ncbi:MAG TPA: hypothetical protein VK922_06065 [Gemmatimonadaceae bacterium]|nr:hypothetical protein [Gemmatimonadaceae bacterium]
MLHPTILSPDECRTIVPALAATRSPDVWGYRFTHDGHGWTLTVATHAAPGSDKLSLGGFRIAPEERMAVPGFTTDREAIALAMGMEEKVHWSRLIGIGGPLVRRDVRRIVGGKCVLAPSSGYRVGEPGDAELLDFAAGCFRHVEATAGIHITTGQDLGHGAMHGGTTSSLAYLAERHAGSVLTDTSVPTGEGNYRILEGMLRAYGVALPEASVGLIGCGNIGMHLVRRLGERRTAVTALESRAERRTELEAMGIAAWPPEAKREFLAQPMDAIAVNAAGGSLDRAAVEAILENPRLQVICGSENLVMPEPALALALRDARKIYAPTELGGMMGYLTAAEEYLSRMEGAPFDVATLLDAAKGLDSAGFAAAERVRNGGFRETFEEAVTAIYGGPGG